MSARAKAAALTDKQLDELRLDLATSIPKDGGVCKLTAPLVREALAVVMAEIERRADADDAEKLLGECEEWTEQAAHALDNAEPDDRLGIGAAHHIEVANECRGLAERLGVRRLRMQG